MSDKEQASMSFVLVTNGEDREIDTIGIIVEAIKRSEMNGCDIRRVLNYLYARYTRTVTT